VFFISSSPSLRQSLALLPPTPSIFAVAGIHSYAKTTNQLDQHGALHPDTTLCRDAGALVRAYPWLRYLRMGEFRLDDGVMRHVHHRRVSPSVVAQDLQGTSDSALHLRLGRRQRSAERRLPLGLGSSPPPCSCRQRRQGPLLCR